MANSALGSNINTAASLSTLLSTLLGGGNKTTTTSGGTNTTTKSTNVSAEGLQALIQSMLEDQSTGLAKVASGAKQAGLYNSSSNTLLVNDLISRASNSAALASAPTTTTSTTTPQSQVTSSQGLLGANSNTLLPLLGAGLLMKKDDAGKSVFDNLLGAVFGGGSGSDSSTSIGWNIGSALPVSDSVNFSVTGSDFITDIDKFNGFAPLTSIISSALGTEGIGSVVDGASDSGLFESISSGVKDLLDTIGGWF